MLMKNYIKDIISRFAHNDYTTDVRNKILGWMADEEHAAQKDEALHGLWEEARAAGMPRGMNHSIRTMRRNLNLPVARSFSILRYNMWRAAAIVFLVASSASAYWAMNQKNSPAADLVQSYTPCAEMRTLTLPDGTQVLLNSKTTLLYPAAFSGETRSVYLIGEANFKVKPDKEHPFIVKSADFQVTALGTEFQVTAYPEEEEVEATLLSGSVKVEFNNLSESILLKPSEQWTYDKAAKTSRILHPDMDECTAWQHGDLVFCSEELEDIITQLERKYPYTFVYSTNALNSRDTYSFRFSAGAEIKEVMDIISRVVDIDYRIKENKCYLTNKK